MNTVQIHPAYTRLIKASRGLADANTALDEAQREFEEAMHAIEVLEAAAEGEPPNFREMRGILK